MSRRLLVVVADDLGIGPATDRGVLDAAAAGAVTAAALLVNTPYAAAAVRAWHAAGEPAELGWHANLTLDRPVLPPEKVPSLVGRGGTFRPLAAFLARWAAGRIDAAEAAAELRAQYVRFLDLVGSPPAFVNAHQHVCLFPPVGESLLTAVERQRPRPFLRRVVEAWPAVARVPGARRKRAVLNWLGRKFARRTDRLGYPGCQQLAGVTDPPHLADDFWPRRLAAAGGATVELVTHPGHRDESLWGRDLRAGDEAGLRRRVRELELLLSPDFAAACRRHRFRLATPSGVAGGRAARGVAA